MDVGAGVLVQLESAIVFGDGCGCDRVCGIGECDRACGIGECDRVWEWMWVRSGLWDWRVRSCLGMDVGAIVLVELESAIALNLSLIR